MKYPNTGEFFIFNKPNNYKHSTIERHCNAILKSLATSHYLLKQFKQLDLDALLFAKNAPGDSRHDAVEHGWAPITKRLAGFILPAEVEGKEDAEVLNQATETLTNIMSGMVYDGFKVVPISVKSVDGDVEIDGKVLNNCHFNDFDEVTKFYEGTISRERLRHLNPEIHKEALFLAKHLDSHLHFLAIRKCSPLEGNPCK